MHCPLLELPAELRTLIYTLAVTSDSAVTICMDKTTAPPITRTNHLIRSESLSIFYNVNTFHVKVQDYDIRSIQGKITYWEKLYKPSKDVDARNNVVCVECGGARIWSNFVEWADMTHDGMVPVLWDGGVADDDGALVESPLVLLQQLGTDFKDCSKETVMVLLDCMKMDEKILSVHWDRGVKRGKEKPGKWE